MKKNILSLAALLIASATFVACSNDDNIIDEQHAKAQTYTMTINAAKGGDTTTRALTLGRNDDDTKNVLNASWATSENVYVQKGSDWATGSLQPQTDGATATLKGTLSGITIAEDDVLTLQFPRSGALDYTGQVGTLADIAAKYDYATATVTVAGISATGNIIPETATTTFTNQQAIVKFTLKDKGNSDAAISATELTVSDGTNSYTVTPASGIDEIYVAIPGFSSQTVTLIATDGTDTYTYEKANVTFTNGQYYEITVKMTKEVAGNIVDLSALDADYTAQSGDVLTGTLGGNYKISIADGATVTLKDLTINGTNGSDNAYKHAGLSLAGDGTIVLKGTNTVKGFYEDYPGIFVPVGKTVTIKGDGSLNASPFDGGTDNSYGAGIGGGYNIACGNITIEGGNITATGGRFAAGIGGGNGASCGNITITDGVTSVTATKGANTPNSIGAGNQGSCGTVTIGGNVGVISDSPYTYQP